MLSELQIMKEAGDRPTYSRGCAYYNAGRVMGLELDEASNSFEATVRGEYDYTVGVELDHRNELRDYYCECPAYQKYEGACKHIVAVLKAIQTNWRKFYGEDSGVVPMSVRGLIDFYTTEASIDRGTRQKAVVSLAPTLFFHAGYASMCWLEFTIGTPERMYVVKDVKKLLDAHVAGVDIQYGKNLTYRPGEMCFDQGSRPLFEMMLSTYRDEMNFYRWGKVTQLSSFSDRRFILSTSNLAAFFELVGHQPFCMAVDGDRVQTKVVRKRPDLTFAVEPTKSGIRVKLLPEDAYIAALDQECRYICYEGVIYAVDDTFAKYIRPLLHCFVQLNRKELIIPTRHSGQVLESVVPGLESIASVMLDSALPQRFYRQPLDAHVYFDRCGDGVSCWMMFRYGEVEIDPTGQKNQGNPEVNGKVLLRDTVKEKKIIGLLHGYGFKSGPRGWNLEGEEGTYEFLQRGVPELSEMASIYYTKDLKSMKVKQPGKVSAGVRLNTERGILQMSFEYENMDAGELIELLAAHKLRKRYHRLKNGTFVSLETPEFESTVNMVEQLGVTTADLMNQAAELPKFRAMYLDSLARDNKGFALDRNSAFRRMVQDVREPQDMEYEVPQGITGKLREYQKTGFRWLKTLAHYGFGGILADDMGLGKTLQVIAFLLSEKGTDTQPSLVVAPTSLLYNWEEEVRKFAPELKVTVISGQPGERKQRLADINDSDIVVTSYGLIRRDIELYQQTLFKYCFVDEAQNIKNPNTQNAKSVKLIKARGYFALTGTPIENSLTELWSIFDFLMPGYLLNQSKFTSIYETPIIRHGDKRALQELGRHIRPFVLRRMKKDVLQELPEKVESKVVCEMTREQSKLYAAYMMRARQEFETEVKTHGFEQSRIKILALLTRLRQICCHPGMFLEDYNGGSGKLDSLLELLKEGLAGGRRVLVFSQFTTMLGLVSGELKKTKIDFHYLDGSTPAEERMRMVNAFNGGDKQVFLLSLKAGGTGLNLTGADMVVHCDPWWNPAVEDQATDRAYRIGQRNSVQVYKLISRTTIEERIYELQEAKKALVDAVIKPGENFLTKMSEEEIRQLFVVTA